MNVRGGDHNPDMTTEWAHLTRTDWATKPDVTAGTALLARWFDIEVPIRVVIGRELGGGDKEVVQPLVELGYQFTSGESPVALVLHPAPKDQKRIVDGLRDDRFERALTLLWMKEPIFEGWLASLRSTNIAAPTPQSDTVDAVIFQAMVSLELMRNDMNGIKHGYGKDYAVSSLRLLHEAGYDLGNPGLEGAAFRAGLAWDEVVDLREFANGVKINKRYQLGSERFSKNAVAGWRADAFAGGSDG